MDISVSELEHQVLGLTYEMVISIPHLDFVSMEIVKMLGEIIIG